MLLIGLTGSIATGKSTASRILSSEPYSLPLIDADILARRAVDPGTWGYRRIVSTFGPSTPDLLLPASDPVCSGREDGLEGKGRPLNRPALGRRVFGSSEERTRDRKKLNGIIHPIVRFYMFRDILCYFVRGHWAVVLDVPLLFESGLDVFCSNVLVVGVRDPAVQMERLRERDDHLSEDDAKNRVGSQVDVREKARRAEQRGSNRGDVVWNDGDKEQLRVQIDQVVRRWKSRSDGVWKWVLLLCPPVLVASVGAVLLRNWLVRRRIAKERGEELPKAKL